MTEKEMVLRAKNDVSAFDAIYDTYFPQVFRFVLMRVRDRNVAEEVVSTVFFKAMRKIDLFRWRSIPFSAWLYRIALHEISNYYREEKKRWRLEKGVMDEMIVAQPTEDPMSFEFITEYVKQLPQKDQDIIVLRYFDKKSFEEISQILGKRENTLRVMLHRALKKLEKLIPEEVLAHVYEKVS